MLDELSPILCRDLPANGDVCIATCYFNPCSYESQRRNVVTFIQSLERQGVPCIIAECTFGNRPFELPASPRVVQLRARDVLWHKEHLMNVAARKVPRGFKAIAWVDCDVLFANPNWAAETARKIESTPIIQPYHYAYRLEPGQRTPAADNEPLPAMAYLCEKDRSLLKREYIHHGFTGLAWAARRDFFDSVCLYEAAMSGANDHIMAHPFFASLDDPCLTRVLGGDTPMRKHFNEWAVRAAAFTGGKCGAIEGDAYHLWHGNELNRRYADIGREMLKLDINPYTDINWAASPLEWSQSRRDLAAWSELNMQLRKEDSNKTTFSSTQEEFPPSIHRELPVAGDVCVVTCHYNPIQYESPRRNLVKFLNGLERQGVPYVIVECAFDDRPFELPESPRVIHLRARDVLWHKEHLLNLAAQRVPAGFTAIAWVDGDIIFTNPNWPAEAARRVQKTPVVHLFHQAYRLERGETIPRPNAKPIYGMAAVCEQDRSVLRHGANAHGKPGFAWAARRDLFTTIGLYEGGVIGGGDHLMAHAFYGDTNVQCVDDTFRQGAAARKHYDEWAAKAKQFSGGTIGVVPGTIYHLWHGTETNRKYYGRWVELMNLNYDPSTDIDWTTSPRSWKRPELAMWARKYFMNRREDSDAPQPPLPKPPRPANDPFPASLYEELPVIGGLCAVTSYFNPANDETRKRNLAAFLHGLEKQKVPYIIAECAMGDAPFAMPASPRVLQVRAEQPIWYKEFLLNVAARQVPDRFEAIAWLDADVLFTNPNWAEDAQQRLQKAVAVQLFERAFYLEQGATAPVASSKSVVGVASVCKSDPYSINRPAAEHGLAGLAWAARRSFLQQVGLYETALDGTADHLMAHAFYGAMRTPCTKELVGESGPMLVHFQQWAAGAYNAVCGAVDFVPGDVHHLWHPRRQEQNDLNELKFSPYFDLDWTISPFRVASNKPDLLAWTRRFVLGTDAPAAESISVQSSSSANPLSTTESFTLNQLPLTAPIFIGGSPRSGATLLRAMLDTHPRICAGPEIKVLPAVAKLNEELTRTRLPLTKAYLNTSQEVSAMLRALVTALTTNFRRASGKPRWAEKTSLNVLHFFDLGIIFPEARFIHVIRDGRDAACSMITMTGDASEAIRTMSDAAKRWNRDVRTGLEQAKHPSMAGRVLLVRYEDLVAQPEATMKNVLEFVSEPWEPAVLNYYQKDRSSEPVEAGSKQIQKPLYRSSINRWKMDMGPKEKAEFKAVAGPLLKELGYATDDNW